MRNMSIIVILSCLNDFFFILIEVFLSFCLRSFVRRGWCVSDLFRGIGDEVPRAPGAVLHAGWCVRQVIPVFTLAELCCMTIAYVFKTAAATLSSHCLSYKILSSFCILCACIPSQLPPLQVLEFSRVIAVSLLPPCRHF